MDGRRAVLADAAIEVLADKGTRGLTHRAVDDRAGLSQGSTSYYFRTREALLKAALDRLAERTEADLATSSGDLAADLHAVLERWLTSERARHMARYELTLESARRPELREVLVRQHLGFVAALAGILESEGVPEAERRAALLVEWIDGVLFTRLVSGGSVSLEDTADMVAGLFQGRGVQGRGVQGRGVQGRSTLSGNAPVMLPRGA